MKSNTILSLLLIQLALSTKAFKTIKYQMRDLMTEAAKANENRLLQEEDFYNYFNFDENEPNPTERPNSTERSHIGSKTPVLGSMDFITDAGHDAGLLSTIYEAYGNHYNLRTGPEDWWYTIIQTVALAIDENSKKSKSQRFLCSTRWQKRIGSNCWRPTFKTC